jgi:poly(3-hydroxybutyrate) depolymerase
MRLSTTVARGLVFGLLGCASAKVPIGPATAPPPTDAAAAPGPEAGNPAADAGLPAGDARAGAPDHPGPPDGGGSQADSRLIGPAARSPGCGKAAAGTSRYERRTISVGGVDREYFLWVPRTYDPERPYPIVFRWHGTGGNGTSGGLEIEGQAREDGIVASPSGLAGRFSLDPAGPDVALFDALLVSLGNELCLDSRRVFSYGFSNGGYFTNLLACVRSSVVRAAAPVAAGLSGTGCTGRVAAWITHGTADATVALSRGMAARDRYLQNNDCQTTAVPDSPAPCVRYQGCAAGFPVVWCPTDGSHDPQGRFSAPGAWAFFQSLP